MSELDAIVVPLLAARIFNGLSPWHLKALALQAEPVAFKRGETLIRAYEEGEAAYLVSSGSVVEMTEDDPAGTPIQELGTGTMVGEMAMLIETLHASTIVARTPVRALKFKRSAIAALISADPELGQHFVSRLCSRLTGIASRLRDVDAMFAGRPADPVPQLGPVLAS